MLVMEFEDFGTKLRSLDDGGEGEDSDILRTLKGVLSRKEQRGRKDRSRRGRTDKTLKGEIFGGFRFVKGPNQAGRDVNVGYVVDPKKMPNVARVFDVVAAGGNLRAVQREFEQAGIPNPSGKPTWSRRTIRNMVLDDVYRPHTHDEISGMVPPGVADTLDPEKVYGISWAGRKKSKFKNHRSKQRVVYETPPEEWTAVPIDLTGSGLDRATADKAREKITDNKSPAKVGDRFWELTGLLKCAECGRNMIAYRRAKQSGHNHYYRCRTSSTVDACANRKSHPAERVENVVYEALRDMVDDQDLLNRKIAERFAEKRRELSRAVSDTAPLVERLASLDRRKEGYWDLAADRDISKETMRRKVEEIDTEREALQTALDDARHRDERLEALDRREKHLLSLVNDGPDKYASIERSIPTEDGSHHEIVSIYSALLESAWSPQQRREFYLGLGLRVGVDADGQILIDGILPDGLRDGGAKEGVAFETLSSK